MVFNITRFNEKDFTPIPRPSTVPALVKIEPCTLRLPTTPEENFAGLNIMKFTNNFNITCFSKKDCTPIPIPPTASVQVKIEHCTLRLLTAPEEKTNAHLAFPTFFLYSIMLCRHSQLWLHEMITNVCRQPLPLHLHVISFLFHAFSFLPSS